jgi:hypothetical protein
MKSSVISIATAAALVSTVFVLDFGMRAAFAYETVPGGACRAANLGQARFLAWSHFGVSNPNPIGGQSYFVLCNLHRDGDQDVSPETFTVYVQYNGTNVTTAHIPVTCTFRDVDSTAEGGATVDNINTQTIGQANGASVPNDVDFQDFVTTITDANTNQHNFVCALHPQTQINMFRMDY